RQPILEYLFFGAAELEACIQFDRGNAAPDEAVLVAADEGIAQRLWIGLDLDSVGLRGFTGAIAEVGFGQALHLKNLQRHDRQEHIYVHVGYDGFDRDRRMCREILRTEQAFFFRAHKYKKQRAPQLFWMRLEGVCYFDQRGRA